MKHRQIFLAFMLLVITLFMAIPASAESYTGGSVITLTGKLTVKAKTGECVLKLFEPVNLTSVVGQNGVAVDYNGVKEIQVLVSKPPKNGTTVRVKGELQGKIDPAVKYATNICLTNAKADVIPNIKKVALSKKTARVSVGKTLVLKASITPKSALQSISWSSSKAKVATVDSSGKVTAISGGTTTITAKAADGKKATCKVTVDVSVTGIKLSKETVTLSKGKTANLQATILPSDASERAVIWSSSNKRAATVDKNGKVKGVATGIATITAKSKDGGKKATCKVLVGKAKLEAVEMVQKRVSIKPGETMKLQYRTIPENAEIYDRHHWGSSEEKVATVRRDGTLQGRRIGISKVFFWTINKEETASAGTEIYCVVSENPVRDIPLTANDLSFFVDGKKLNVHMKYPEVVKLLPGGTTQFTWEWQQESTSYNYKGVSFSFLEESGKMYYVSLTGSEFKSSKGIVNNSPAQAVLDNYGWPSREGNVNQSLAMIYEMKSGKDKYDISFWEEDGKVNVLGFYLTNVEDYY